jgi:hypothetical protein
MFINKTHDNSYHPGDISYYLQTKKDPSKSKIISKLCNMMWPDRPCILDDKSQEN